MNAKSFTAGIVLLQLSAAMMSAALIVRYLEPDALDWLVLIVPSLIGVLLGSYLTYDGLND